MRLPSFALVVLAIPAIAGADAYQYQVFNLGHLGGTFPSSEARGLNNNQVVVGFTTIPNDGRGFRWSDGVMTAIAEPTRRMTEANDINDAGSIVGSAFGDDLPFGPTLKVGNTWTHLGDLGGGGAGRALRVNNSDQVVGFSRLLNGNNHAFYWDGSIHDLGTFGGTESEAYGINQAGHVVGFARTSNTSRHGFVWDGQTMIDINGTLNASSANAINDHGLIVGSGIVTSPLSQAVVWNNRVPTALGVLTSGVACQLQAVNESGVAVGVSGVTAVNGRALFWSQATGLVDLNSMVVNPSGLTLAQATAINENGSISGIARDASGRLVGFLAVVVPAPSASASLLLASLLACRRRR